MAIHPRSAEQLDMKESPRLQSILYKTLCSKVKEDRREEKRKNKGESVSREHAQ